MSTRFLSWAFLSMEVAKGPSNMVGKMVRMSMIIVIDYIIIRFLVYEKDCETLF